MAPTSLEILATTLFVLAILHTFSVKWFSRAAAEFPQGSIPEKTFHFLAETEVIFGLWGAVLCAGIAVLEGSFMSAVHYVESLNYAEPKFVFAVMVVAATRPIIQLSERLIDRIASLLPLSPNESFYITALSAGTLLGSFITEPAAMTLIAILLKQRFYDRGISKRFAYLTLGVLFVNISIGGTLTHFAAPPVLMVA